MKDANFTIQSFTRTLAAMLMFFSVGAVSVFAQLTATTVVNGSTSLPSVCFGAAAGTVTSQAVVSLPGGPLFNLGGQVGVSRVRVQFNPAHTWANDLTITLTAPNGVVRTLWAGADGSASFRDVTFDPTSATAHGALSVGLPGGPLPGNCIDGGPNFDTQEIASPQLPNAGSIANGLFNYTTGSANGTWTLSVTDPGFGDGGILSAWSIEFSPLCSITCPANVGPIPSTAPLCGANVVIPAPTLSGANCGCIYGTTPIQGASTPLNFVANSVVVTPFSVSGLSPLNAANFGTCGLPATVTIPITFAGDFDFGAEAGVITTVGEVPALPNTTMPNSPGQCTPPGTFNLTVPVATYNAWVADGTINFQLNANININGPALCAATAGSDFIRASVLVPTSAGSFVNNFNNTADASGVYPVGTTNVVYTARSTSGAQSTCSFAVTVFDAQGPTFPNCPASPVVFNLGPGTCDTTVTFNLTAVDNCTPNPQVLGTHVTAPRAPGTIGQSQLFFNITNNNAFSIELTNIAQFFRAACIMEVYTTPNTFVGKLTNPAAWTRRVTGFNATASGLVNPLAIPLPPGVVVLTPGQTIGVLLSANIQVAGGPQVVNLQSPINGLASTTPQIVTNNGITITNGVLTNFAGGAPFSVGNGAFGQQGTIPATDFSTFLGNVSYRSLPLIVTQTSGIPAQATPGITPPNVNNGPNTFTFSIPTSPQVMTFTTTDGVNPAQCQFTVQSNEFPNKQRDIECQDLVYVSLDNDCRAVLNARQLLLGNRYGCFDLYPVNILPGGGNVLTGAMIGMKMKYEVTDQATGNKCWGEVIAEDKLPPVITNCNAVTVPCTTPTVVDNVFRPVTGRLARLERNFAPAQTVPDNPPTNITQTLALVGVRNAVVTDVNVNVDISHTWTSDLKIALIGPNGTTVTLVGPAGLGGAANGGYQNTTFDDQAAANINTGAVPFTGTFRPINFPANQLAALNGIDPNGDWTVRFTDGVGGDVGTLRRVRVEITYSGEAVTGGIPGPTIVDGCDANPSITFSDRAVSSVNCGNTVFDRIWVATDRFGNRANCTQRITQTPVAITDITLPRNKDDIQDPALSCSSDSTWTKPQDSTFTVGGRTRTIKGTGFPTVDGINLANGQSCNLTLSYEDIRHDVCANGYKILRRWTIINWCNAQVVNHNQIIKVLDKEAPMLLCPSELINNQTVSTDPYACTATVRLPAPGMLMDNCASPSQLTYSLFYIPSATIAGQFPQAQVPITGNTLSGLVIGRHIVGYTAKDPCGNTSTCTIRVDVRDYVQPIALCTRNTVVTLNSDGIAIVPAEDFDQGSYDNCGLVDFWVRRDGPALQCSDLPRCARLASPAAEILPNQFRKCIKFDCCDAAQDSIRLTLRVYDAKATQQGLITTYPDPLDSSQIVLVGIPIIDSITNEGIFRYTTTGVNRVNFTECMVIVKVQDKIAPTIVCPKDATVFCDGGNDLVSFGNFGTIVTDPSNVKTYNLTDRDYADVDCDLNFNELINNGQRISDGYASDLCGIVLDSVIDRRVQCGRGQIFREWTATDLAGLSSRCIQTINVLNRSDWGVEFPADTTITTCPTTPLETGEPRYTGVNCETIAVFHEDEVLKANDACYKILRTWKVLDWCSYDPARGNFVADISEQAAAAAFGIPGFQVGSGPFRVSDYNQDGQITDVARSRSSRIFRNGWPRENIRFNPGGRICSNPGAADGCFEYVQIIKVQDLVAPTFTDTVTFVLVEDLTDNNPNLFGSICESPTTVRVTATDACSPNNITYDWIIDGFGDGTIDFSGTGNVINRELPYGRHIATFTAMDGCGNMRTKRVIILVRDAKKPTIICYFGLSVNIMNSNPGMVSLWANDLVQKAEDNCGPVTDLRIRKAGATPGTTPPPAGSTEVTYTCAELGSQPVEVWGKDDAGNWDYCATFIRVVNTGGCPTTSPRVAVAGTIRNEINDGIQNVTVTINGGSSVINSVTTPADGSFRFDNLITGQDYSVVPSKNTGLTNGVDTRDLSLIQQHILSSRLLNSPYLIIAADANKDGNVRASDIAELRKAILGISANLPNGNTSWRFVEKAHTFANPKNPFATVFPELKNLNNVTADVLDVDFVAIKVGDVNNSATPNQLIGSEVRNLKGNLTFNTEAQQVVLGKEYSMNIKASDFTGVNGYQFTMNFDKSKLEFVDMIPGALEGINEGNFGLLLDQGVITSSWNSLGEGKNYTADQTLFTLRFRANGDGNLKDLITIGSNVTSAAAYKGSDNLDVKLNFTNGGAVVSTDKFELFQNKPNPVRDITVVGFNLVKAQSATLTIYDVAGKVVKVVNGDYAKGYNTVLFERGSLTSGVLYYKLDTDSDSATMKMILVD
jgi:subtilisin-like proprotein convertase family protein